MIDDADLISARAVADAVMYEGYLLYPYRASAAKNQIRWQFGVLGPRGAAAAGVGEDPDMATEILVRHGSRTTVTVRLRFLHLQARSVESFDAADGFVSAESLQVGDQRWLAWDEAIEQELVVGRVPLGDNHIQHRMPVKVEAGEECTELRDQTGGLAGRLVRRRRPLSVMVHVGASTLPDEPDVSRLRIRVENLAMLAAPITREEAAALSLLGAHLLLTCESGEFISLLDPPTGLERAVQECHQHRCWPVLAGPVGNARVLLVSPIILEDHPSLAPESAGALFDSTEIDEILTLRILTMTEQEKSEARATDPRAAEIIDRSESLSTDEMARLHGVLRNPHALEDAIPTWSSPPERAVPGPGMPGLEAPGLEVSGLEVPGTTASGTTGDVPWWDPEQDASVDPGTDTVMVAGRAIGRGSFVRIHPNRRADAQDLFFADQRAKVTGVHFDVDGETHVGVVLVDDPAAEVNEWYGRFLYFAPDELEPIEAVIPSAEWKES